MEFSNLMLQSLLSWKTDFNRRTILHQKIQMYFFNQAPNLFYGSSRTFRNFTENHTHPRFFLRFIMRNIEIIIRKSEMHFFHFDLSVLFLSKTFIYQRENFASSGQNENIKARTVYYRSH